MATYDFTSYVGNGINNNDIFKFKFDDA